MLTCAALAIGLNLASYHLDRDYPFQESNPGVYAICDDWILGIYRNSFAKNFSMDRPLDRVTVHIGKIFSFGPVDIEIGLATGYGKKTRREVYSPQNSAYGCTPGHQWCDITEGTAEIIPIVIPSIRLGAARLGLVPPLSSKHRGAVTFSVEWEVK